MWSAGTSNVTIRLFHFFLSVIIWLGFLAEKSVIRLCLKIPVNFAHLILHYEFWVVYKLFGNKEVPVV